MAVSKVRDKGGTTHDIEDLGARADIAALKTRATALEAADVTLATGVSEAKAAAESAQSTASTASSTATTAKSTADGVKTLVGTLPETTEADTVVEYVDEQAGGAKDAADLATARVESMSVLDYPLKFKKTTATAPVDGVFYYTYAGDSIYKKHTGKTDTTVTPHIWKSDPFVAGTDYYEVDQSGDKMPQIFVNASNRGQAMWDGFDPRMYCLDASVAIGHHARCIPGNDKSCWNTAIGQNSQAGDGDAGDQCTAIGEQTKAIRYSCTAIGSKAAAKEYGALAIGWGATANGLQSMCIGRGATTTSAAAGSIMLGPGTNSEPQSCYFGVGEPKFNKVAVYTYSLTTDTTFKSGKDYYTKSGTTYTKATVTVGAAVPANTYYEKKHNLAGEGASYFIITGGAGTTANPYIYSKYNIIPGSPLPETPDVYTLSTVSAYTYKLIGKDGKIPPARFPEGTVDSTGWENWPHNGNYVDDFYLRTDVGERYNIKFQGETTTRDVGIPTGNGTVIYWDYGVNDADVLNINDDAQAWIGAHLTKNADNTYTANCTYQEFCFKYNQSYTGGNMSGYINSWVRCTKKYSVAATSTRRFKVRVTGLHFFSIYRYPSGSNSGGGYCFDDKWGTGKEYGTTYQTCISRAFDWDLPIAHNQNNLYTFCAYSPFLERVHVPYGQDYPWIQNCSDIFLGCTNLKEASNLRYSFRFSRYITAMFSGCTNLEFTDMRLLPIAFSSNSNASVFNGCAKLAVDVASLLPEAGFSSPEMDLSNTFNGCLALTVADAAKVKKILWGDVDRKWTHSNTFAGAAAAVRNIVPSNWGGLAVVKTGNADLTATFNTSTHTASVTVPTNRTSVITATNVTNSTSYTNNLTLVPSDSGDATFEAIIAHNISGSIKWRLTFNALSGYTTYIKCSNSPTTLGSTYVDFTATGPVKVSCKTFCATIGSASYRYIFVDIL